ncbi:MULTISPECIES: flagellar hook protein FlgE [Roseobacter]|uniref:Flagellar hook protein FlgE n=1 Tax=Roseobacter litoralis (strain ATCC 49566 / DSM 6996 / JCM 21268 / NBRC 15278 / OCh 149) TaxID=391595 RepID=F7ZBP6_ROSLO|nr:MULTISPECIES: flagellar hook-basal body complex protein [Roseobacter]AEI95628.1 putative flagellar-hook protein FlgE [Roseobacter litoralis Och 149]GIT88893.1 flagellar hook protein FlgE [Roseobacter sp. OBYS 0001]
MSISSSLNAGVAGLQTNSQRLASISDNIANSSTFGYKRVQTDFESMVLSSGGGSYAAGGVRANTQRLIDERGTLVSTSNSTDLAVRGGGMLPVAQSAQVQTAGADAPMFLTTTGSFRTDAEGYLTSQSGLVLMGWPAAADGSIPVYPRDTADGLEPVRIATGQLAGNPTTSMSLGINLPATETEADSAGLTEQISVEYFDNLGTSQSVSITFTPDVPAPGNPATNTWTMEMFDSVNPAVSIGSYTLEFNDSRTGGGSLFDVTPIGASPAYSDTTGLITINVAAGPIEVDIGALGDTEGLSQLSYSFAPISVTKDGSAIGNFVGVDVDPNGFVRASFDTGEIRTIYQIPLINVPNPNGLQAFDSQTYLPSRQSGAFFLWNAGDGPTGDIVSFAREESTTDVAGELTDMIKTQRAYSSNAKVIQTVDEMLQETTNIKR